MTRYRVHGTYGGMASMFEVYANNGAQARQIVRDEAPALRIIEITPIGGGPGPAGIIRDAGDEGC